MTTEPKKGNFWKMAGYLVIAFLLIVFFSEYFKSCKELESQDDNIKKEINDTTLTRKDKQIAEQKAIIAANQEQIKKYVEQIDGYKTYLSQTKVKQVVVYKDKLIPYYVPPQIIKVKDSTGQVKTMLRLPAKFGLSEQWFSLASTVDTNGMKIDSLSVKSELTTTIGWKEQKGINRLLKNPEPIVTYHEANPYSRVVSARNISYQAPKKKWYETRVASLFFGLGAGYIIFK